MVVNMVILKLSRKIVNENQVIAVENLNAKAMVRNHNLRDLRFDNVIEALGTQFMRVPPLIDDDPIFFTFWAIDLPSRKSPYSYQMIRKYL